VSIGVAAHITAAAPGGPRYDSTFSAAQRKSAENGIWLCANCARLIDSDSAKYTVALLHEWKNRAEIVALEEIESNRSSRNVSTKLLALEGIAAPSARISPLDEFPEHWKQSSICFVRLYSDGEEPKTASLDDLIERAKAVGDSDLVRGFTVIREVLHALSNPERPVPPIIPTDDFPIDIRKCYELCHEIFMCAIVLLRAIGMPYGHLYDQAERERLARLLARLWTRLAQVQPYLEKVETILLHTSDKVTAGVSAHKTIVAGAEFLIQEIVAITEFNWMVVGALRGWNEGDKLPFGPEKLIEKWPDVYRKLHVSEGIDQTFNQSKLAFASLAIEAAKAAEVTL
jgi:hypothetical protein